MNQNYCVAPASGKVIPLEMVADPVFSGKSLGDGVAVIPNTNCVYVPISGVLKLMFYTGHAFVIEGKNGEEVMVHIGIDTVNYRGVGFHQLMKQGRTVQRGEAIVRFDEAYLKDADMTTMLILMNREKEERLQKNLLEHCEGGTDVVLEW